MEDFFYQHGATSVVRAWGEDAEDYLQSQWTIDIKKIKVGEVRFGLRLSSKGKILAGAYIAHVGDEEFLLIAEKIPAPEIIKMMEENVVADEIEFSDQSDEWKFLSLYFSKPTVFSSQFDLSSMEGNQFLKNEGANLWVDARMQNGFYLALIKKNTESKIIPFDSLTDITEERYEYLRIQNGKFSIPAEIGQEDLPQEAAMEKYAVDFNKGCYLGQEVMARLHAMGQVQKQVKTVRWEGKNGTLPTLPANIIMDQKLIGSLKSIARHNDSFIGVAKIHLKAKERLGETGLDLENMEMGKVFSL